MNSIRIAVVVMQSKLGEIRENIDRICFWVEKASKLNVDIICFPELSITGYSNSPKIASVAISRSNKNINQLISLSSKKNIVIMPGMAEKELDNKIYVTHLVINPNKKIAFYRKIHLAPPEKKFFTKGNSFSLFRAKKLNFGIQLCYDSHFPELSTSMSLGGADVIFMPHASPNGTARTKHESWMRHLPARAFDNGIFLIACNQVSKNNRPGKLNFPGNALSLSPLGKIITKKMDPNEGLIVLDINFKELKDIRQHRMRYFLPNREPGSYEKVPDTINLDYL